MTCMRKNITIGAAAAVAAIMLVSAAGNAKVAARFDMELNHGSTINDAIGNSSLTVSGIHAPENVAGVRGNALRLDGYSSFAEGVLEEILPAATPKMTASLWVALETYPIVKIDVNTPDQVVLASCLDDNAKTGFGFFVGFDGKYSFKTYLGGWPLELKVNEPLQTYEWVNLTAVIDTEARTSRLYNNGRLVASGKASGDISIPAGSAMRIGRNFPDKENLSAGFCLTSINGLIDDLTIWDEALSEKEITAMKADREADLSIPSSRFANDPMRPRFHGMPGANWTNEPHGMTYSDGRWHVFFQKNANGPYMARLHWGHISSENLYDWREEKIAIAPGEDYDIKGCWSGNIFTDPEIGDGKPTIIYTAVDYARAVIAMASPEDESLINWSKAAGNPIINGRPGGLADDFRDPYFFRNGDKAYIIVGSSKDGIGTTTLHEYNPATKSWSNDGLLFFTGNNLGSCGRFWEMPTINKLGDKWLFTATPLETSKGVAALYWVGDINADGTFAPLSMTPGNIELPGLARDGYGLLSPTIHQKDGKTIALGIVPDKLWGNHNAELGYAHTYSLPREWSLDEKNQLVQKPYSGLTAMRSGSGYSKADFRLSGRETLDGVEGRAVELIGEFVVGKGKSGFTLLDDGHDALQIYYDGARGQLVVDARELDRLSNDTRSFSGLYESSLPQTPAAGSVLKLQVFFDHSILDIFVNDTYATSIRVFANGKDEEKVTVMGEGDVEVKSVKGWNLNAATGSGVDAIIGDEASEAEIRAIGSDLHFKGVNSPAKVAVYDIAGAKVFESMLFSSEGIIPTNLKGMHIVTLTSSDSTSATAKVMLSW